MNKDMHLSSKLFAKDVNQEPTRDGFGKGLLEAGRKNKNVVGISADLTESTRMNLFADEFPERAFNTGVAEQNLATMAAGMTALGKIPFVSSYATFSPGRNWEQIRTTICINDRNVKIVGSHAGVSVGPDGATHQALEDIATMRVMPNMVVIYPADAVEAKKATVEAAKNGKPTYLRFARENTPQFSTEDTPFKIGEAITLWDPSAGSGPHGDPQVAIVAAGPLVYEALLAARELSKKKIDVLVINSHTIKPLDEQAIIKAAKLTGAVVTVEEAQAAGGLGGAVTETLAKNFPVPIEFIGVQDHFGESGKPEELLKKFGLKSENIIDAVKKVIGRKNRS